MIRKTLAVSIVFLFIVTAVSPMVIGENKETKEINYELEAELANLRYLCTTPDGFDDVKFEYYKEHLVNDYSNNDLDVVEVVEPVYVVDNVEPNLPLPLDGPMDSPWPMKCHDTHHTSQSPYSTADNPYDEYWSFRTDGWMQAGMVIDNDGTIYFGELGQYLFALNPDGTEKWRFEIDGIWIWSTPAIAEDGTIYVSGFDAKLYAVNPDGTLKWKFSAGASISSSPAIGEDGTIYFGNMLGGAGYRIYAVNPNGTKKWHYQTGYHVISDPAIGDDGTIYIGSGDNYFYAMNPNGTLKWRYKTGDYIKGHASIADDGTIYVGSWDDYLYAFYPNGTLKWKHEVDYGLSNNPAIRFDGTIYCSGEYLYAIHPDGTRKWTFDFGGDKDGYSSSPAISADGTIYVGLEIGQMDGGEIIAVNPDGTERWRKRISNDEARSSPCIDSNGTVYIGSSSTTGTGSSYGYLHAFGRGPLFVDAGGPYSGIVGEELLLTGTVYGGNPPYTIHWDLGDGGFSNEQNPKHIYSTVGEYVVNISVTDSDGNKSYDESIVSIGYHPPSLRVLKPKHAFYFLNLMIIPFLIPIEPVIIGYINIKVEVTHECLDIERVEFYIDDEFRFTDYNLPYSWVWNDAGKYPNWHTIEIVAYDSDGKSTSEKFYVLKLFENNI